MARTIANPGDKYNRLTLIEEVEQKNKIRYFLCRCDCGNTGKYRLTGMRAGVVKSCGCQKIDSATKHSMSRTRLYHIWRLMKDRCTREKSKGYHNYGGRGILLCDEWQSFVPFMKWAKDNGYSDTLTIERNNVNGNYHPSNCRWATIEEQCRNRRNNVFVEHDNIRLCLKDWATKVGIAPSVLKRRLNKMTVSEALNTPVREKLPNGLGARYNTK